eukprot:COSAG02_NODE_857_length_16462_cov_4.801381_7_plen_90_part_00
MATGKKNRQTAGTMRNLAREERGGSARRSRCTKNRPLHKNSWLSQFTVSNYRKLLSGFSVRVNRVGMATLRNVSQPSNHGRAASPSLGA